MNDININNNLKKLVIDIEVPNFLDYHILI